MPLQGPVIITPFHGVFDDKIVKEMCCLLSVPQSKEPTAHSGFSKETYRQNQEKPMALIF